MAILPTNLPCGRRLNYQLVPNGKLNDSPTSAGCCAGRELGRSSATALHLEKLMLKMCLNGPFCWMTSFARQSTMR